MKSDKSASALEAILQTTTVKQYSSKAIRSNPYAVIYTRVSSKEQADNNSSLETQKKICSEYAKQHGLIIKEYFGGTYDSAKTDGRKEFQRMISYAKKDKDISFIIVLNYDRFSRTGPDASRLSRDLRSLGIVLKSVTQDIDSSNPSGVFQEDLFHLFNNYDNQQRAARTKMNTREIMLKGYWTYATPLGYINLKPKHRACDHIYEITEQGKWLKKAFQWKAEGILTNKEIIERIKPSGLGLTKSNFRWVLSNPFYAGYVTGNLVGGKLIKGHHPALIDLKTFLKANQLLNGAPTVGIAKTHRNEDLPLKIFAKDELSRCQFTGYHKKGHWYYKTRNTNGKVNINAVRLNNHFSNLLEEFEYKKEYGGKLKTALYEKLKKKLGSNLQNSIQLKKRIAELENKLNAIEEKYVLGKLEAHLYGKYAEKYSIEVSKLKGELGQKAFDSSNLEKIIEKGVLIAENISQLWISSDFSQKQKLQYLVFPDGILYSKEKDAVRTEKVNDLFAEISLLKRVLKDNKKGNPKKDCLKSNSVPETGIEC